MGLLDSARAIAIVGTADRKVTKPFYRDTLGLKLVSEDHFADVFEIGSIQMRLSAVPGYKAHNHTVLGFEVKDIDASVAAFRAKGIKFNIYEGFGQDANGIWTSPQRDARVAWFNDPDGNVLSLTQF
jgi:catechol 2,3-dioxygenase-like lactoylglutathione lyase family enzyme